LVFKNTKNKKKKKKKKLYRGQASLRTQSERKKCTIISGFGMSLILVGPIEM
jgi:hypothetical protein